MSTTILDPTGHPLEEPGCLQLAADRPKSFHGLTVGLLENTKHNAALLLDELADQLTREYGIAGVVRRTKAQFALPVPDKLLMDLKDECDIVITGIGDCGSCSASAVADGIAFERAGMPAAVICTDAFHSTAGAMATMKEAPNYRYLTTSHPMAILDPSEVRLRAEELLPQVVSVLSETQFQEDAK